MILIIEEDDLKDEALYRDIDDIVLVRDLKSFGNFTPLMLLFSASRITIIKDGKQRLIKDMGVCLL